MKARSSVTKPAFLGQPGGTGGAHKRPGQHFFRLGESYGFIRNEDLSQSGHARQNKHVVTSSHQSSRGLNSKLFLYTCGSQPQEPQSHLNPQGHLVAGVQVLDSQLPGVRPRLSTSHPMRGVRTPRAPPGTHLESLCTTGLGRALPRAPKEWGSPPGALFHGFTLLRSPLPSGWSQPPRDPM